MKKTETISLKLSSEENNRLQNLCGQYNQNLQQIEKYLNVEIHQRGSEFQILGDLKNAKLAKDVLAEIYKLTESAKNITSEQIHLLLHKHNAFSQEKTENNAELIKINTAKLTITPKTPNQLQYIKNIFANDVNFGIGPAGTGKTYLAAACAVAMLLEEKVSRIVLVRPVVEAGEHLGFLPGDIQQKVDPYLRPLYDALYDMLGAAKVEKLIAERIVEIAPLAFMRGRTLNSAFIILDESQNATIEQMKMLLTRVGFGSKVVVNGDVTQIDLAKNRLSGLIHAAQILQDISGISFSYFTAHDVVRHKLVQQIIKAYETASNK